MIEGVFQCQVYAVKILKPEDGVHEHEKSSFGINTAQVVLLCSLKSEPSVHVIVVLGVN